MTPETFATQIAVMEHNNHVERMKIREEEVLNGTMYARQITALYPPYEPSKDELATLEFIKERLEDVGSLTALELSCD